MWYCLPSQQTVSSMSHGRALFLYVSRRRVFAVLQGPEAKVMIGLNCEMFSSGAESKTEYITAITSVCLLLLTFIVLKNQYVQLILF